MRSTIIKLILILAVITGYFVYPLIPEFSMEIDVWMSAAVIVAVILGLEMGDFILFLRKRNKQG